MGTSTPDIVSSGAMLGLLLPAHEAEISSHIDPEFRAGVPAGRPSRRSTELLRRRAADRSCRGDYMQASTAQATPVTAAAPRIAARPASAASAYQGYQTLRRNGAVVAFEPNKIAVALMKAFLAVHGTQGAASASVRETVDGLTESVVRGLLRSRPGGGTFHIEDVQDQVELGLMRGGHHEVARAYVLYRERRAQERAKQVAVARPAEPVLMVTDRGNRVPLDAARLQTLIESACAGLGADVRPGPILAETKRNLYDGVPIDEVHKAAILAARTLIEKDPGYTRATARLLPVSY